MLKLYVAIYLAGRLVGTVGPVPYDEAECRVRIAEKMASVNSDRFKREIARKEDLVLACEFHDKRPELAPAGPDDKIIEVYP